MGDGKILHFTDLKVWKSAHELELNLYSLTMNFPKIENFVLSSQLRRAATSITANIAEGMGRKSYSDRCRFYYNSRGSVYEIESLLLTSKDLGYVNMEGFSKLLERIEITRKLLNAFISKTLELKRKFT